MIRAIIIDDEQHCRYRLTTLLLEMLDEKIHLMDSFSTYDEGKIAIEKYQPDLIFLDVQLNNGKTAFDLLTEVNIRNAQVIFTTAYEQYAVKAFRFSALDYLLKPIVAEDLMQAVKKISDRNPLIETTKKLEILLGNLYNKDKRICVPVMNGVLVLNVSDIIRCESDINYTTIFIKDKQKITVARTLKDFEEMLSEYKFFRVHNSHLINLSYIRSYNRGKGGSVILNDGTEVEVSTRRKDEFLQKMAAI